MQNNIRFTHITCINSYLDLTSSFLAVIKGSRDVATKGTDVCSSVQGK